ncbi:MAG TPA: hypothetical protein VLG49_02935 [Rhabdochlamydiaceae bacterium]|nr:hypothetical protein [Rhabdochlamydiaceae bacterium]
MHAWFRSTILLLSAVGFSKACAMTGSPISYSAHPELTGPVAWLTGPLLTSSGHVIPPGHLNFEPYIFVSKISHKYDSEWQRRHVSTFVSVLNQYQLKVGVVRRLDIGTNPGFAWNHRHGQAKWVFTDLPLILEYQLLGNRPKPWVPMIKLSLGEVFPTGKYQHLKAKKNGTDIGGQGSFQTQIGIDFGKLIYFGHYHWLSWRLNLNYTYLSPVHVEGLNVYGGAKDTDGTVFPGNQFSQLIGLEYTLNQQWVLALDIVNFYGNKTRFSGKKGTISGVPAKVTLPSMNQISLAPALEYNWSANIGIIAGAWFTVAGRNAPDFLQWVIAFNLYH